MARITLDYRMRAAADFVRQGAVFADIGTDHGYLPVFLFEEKRIKHAIASDIHQAPLERAKRNIKERGYLEQTTFMLANGLLGMENRGLTDIAICGMGGEMIVSVLDNASFVRDSKINLILQPMTKIQDLRRYLAEHGFAIKEERIVKASGKLYFCLLASFTGENETLSPIETLLGRYNIENKPPLFLEMVEKKYQEFSRIKAGQACQGKVDLEVLLFLDELKKLRTDVQG